MAKAQVLLNGTEVAAHKDGYTPFSARLTGRLKAGENEITVKIDGSERPDTPPSAAASTIWPMRASIATSGWGDRPGVDRAGENRNAGRPRDAEERPRDGRPRQSATAEIAGELTARLLDGEGKLVALTKVKAASSCELSFAGLADIALWDIDSPSSTR